jgi:hypothetical protein
LHLHINIYFNLFFDELTWYNLRLGQTGERTVDTREQYLERAAQLRKALDIINDPLARRLLVLTIESLEEAAAPAQQLTLSEESPRHLKDAS